MTPPSANPLDGSELAAFVAAFEAASVHGAGDALGLTASAVSKRLASLERRVGLPLFERGRFGLRATSAGQLLYPGAKQALDALHHAEEALAELRTASVHALSLAASHTVGEFLLPGWLGAFRLRDTRLRAQVDIVNSPGVLAAVRDGRVEIGFVEGLDELDGLEAMVVHHDELVVVVSRGHRWARRRTIPAGELAGEPYLAREAGSGTRAVAAAALAGAGVQLAPAFELASIQSVKRALGSGGFALLSGLAVAGEEHRGALHTLRVRAIDLTRELKAVRRPGALAPQADDFWRWLRERPTLAR